MKAVLRSFSVCIFLACPWLFADDLVPPPQTKNLCSSLLLQVAQGVTENSVKIQLANALETIEMLRGHMSALREPYPGIYRELHETYLGLRPSLHLEDVGEVSASRADRLKPLEGIILIPSPRGFYTGADWNLVDGRLRLVLDDARDSAIRSYAWQIKGGQAIRRYLAQVQSDAYMIEANLQRVTNKAPADEIKGKLAIYSGMTAMRALEFLGSTVAVAWAVTGLDSTLTQHYHQSPMLSLVANSLLAGGVFAPFIVKRFGELKKAIRLNLDHLVFSFRPPEGGSLPEEVRAAQIQESLVEERATAAMLRVLNSRHKEALVYYGSPITQIDGSLLNAWKGRVVSPEMEKATQLMQDKLVNKLVVEDRVLTIDDAGNPILTIFLRIGSRRALLSQHRSL